MSRSIALVACLFMMSPRLAGVAVADPGGPPTRYSELWGHDGEKWSPASRLPDFSFAGYHFGEDPLAIVPVAANVRDFGAKGDGEHDDTQAFKVAIAQTKSGAILVPPGRYVITDILWITKPGLVLRGAGSGQTTLVCPKPLEHIKPNRGSTTEGIPTSNYSWSGGIVWVRGTRETSVPRAITSEAKRGGQTLTVASTSGLAVGQRVHLEITDDASHTLIDHLYAGDPGDTARLIERGPITTTFVSRVIAIDGDLVTLERSLPFDVRLAWQPTLSVFEPDVSEVGIEGICFEFPVTPYEGHFTEAGYNAIAVNAASDCWVRDVRIVNADSGVYLSGTFCTADGMVLESQRPMDVSRQATGHHALQLGTDCLAQNFDFRTHFIHDITVDSDDCRNVVKNGRGVNLSLDHHKRVPYANLFCNLDAGDGSELWRCGGGAALGKHCAAWGTFWNIRTARPVRPPSAAFGPPLINFVGLHTDEPPHLDPNGRWWEAIPPGELQPADLHAAQLARRLDATTKPNVVLIVVDDLGWRDLGCFGSDFHRTPAIDRLAREGMRFDNAYAACTVCSPTRASIMTGRYPARLHLTDWISGHVRPYARLRVPDWTMRLASDQFTLAEAFRQSGYATAHMGKWHLGETPNDWPEHHGFDLNIGGWKMGQPNRNGGGNAYFSPYANPRLPDGPPGEYLTERLAREAVAFIDTHRHRPFFLNLWFYSVHTPLQARPEEMERWKGLVDPAAHQQNPTYAAMVEHVDRAVASILEALEQADLSGNTIVVFTSDNGGLIGNRGDTTRAPRVTSNFPLRAGKGDCYEGGVRIPLIVRQPGRVAADRVSHALTISPDLYPTLLELAGLTVPAATAATLDGISLAPVLRGTSGAIGQDAVFWHYPHYHTEGATPHGAVRRGPWKLIEFYETGAIELYNLDDDIGEQHDLAAEQPGRTRALCDELAAWLRSVGAQMPSANPDYDPTRAGAFEVGDNRTL